MKFRKKPIEVEAYRLPLEDAEVQDSFFKWCRDVNFYKWSSGRDQTLEIETFEGVMVAQPGDWIIKGIIGEFYPCKPDIFNKTYDLVEM